jgi:hypothetical protein
MGASRSSGPENKRDNSKGLALRWFDRKMNISLIFTLCGEIMWKTLYLEGEIHQALPFFPQTRDDKS